MRIKLEALLLLLRQSQPRGAGNHAYNVDTFLHLSLCSHVSPAMLQGYNRLMNGWPNGHR